MFLNKLHVIVMSKKLQLLQFFFNIIIQRGRQNTQPKKGVAVSKRLRTADLVYLVIPIDHREHHKLTHYFYTD